MNFIFSDKSEYEADIITNILASENILFKTRINNVPVYIDCEDEEPYDFVPLYDIICFTDLVHFDFVSKIANEKIQKIKTLNKIFYSKKKKKKK